MKVLIFVGLTIFVLLYLAAASDSSQKKPVITDPDLQLNSEKPMKTLLNVNDFTAWFWATGRSDSGRRSSSVR